MQKHGSDTPKINTDLNEIIESKIQKFIQKI